MKKEYFTSKDNRTIKEGDLVGVHWNSHKKCFSIVSMKTRNTTGLVLGYADNVELTNVSFKIDLSKQMKVRQTGTKDRHAFVVGEIIGFDKKQNQNRIIYNPHKMDTFSIINESNEIKAVEQVDLVWLSSDQNKPIVSYIGNCLLTEQGLTSAS